MPLSESIWEVYRPSRQTVYQLPLYFCPVSAGFPSSAEDYLEGKLDLNQYLVKHPAATFFVRVTRDSMTGAGIHAGDILIVDRSLQPRDGKVVIAVVNGELLVKRLHLEKGGVYLAAENPDYPALVINEAMDLEIGGVVTNVIHPL